MSNRGSCCIGALGLAVFAAGLLAACASPGAPDPGPDGSPLVGRVFDGRAGVFVNPSALFDELAAARFVLLGERHDRPEHHRLQARILEQMVARGRRPAVAFEMLRSDVAGALARAADSPDATPQSVGQAVAWDTGGWPDFALYEPIFAAALAARLPLAAADLPMHTMDGPSHGGLAGLDPGSRQTLLVDAPVPAELRAALAEDVVAGHCGHLHERVVPMMVDVQMTRDANMARALESAAEEGGDGAVLIAGAGHVRRDWAVPWWLALRAPGAAVRSLAFVDVPPALRDPGVETQRYDFVWYTALEDHEDPCEKYREELEALRGRAH
jgi:uncharacterized iron-regulated protein